MRKQAICLALMVTMSACARLPPVDFNYYPSKGVTTVSVVQTFDCSTDKTRLVVVTTPPTVTTAYSADHDSKPITLEISKTRGELTDTDFTITYYDDGRLKGINAVSTGQGEAALKTAISLVGDIVPLIAGGGPGSGTTAACDAIANWGKGKPVSITFTGSVPFNGDDGLPHNLKPDGDSKPLFLLFNRAAPQAQLTLEKSPIVPAVSRASGTSGYVPLKLQKVYPAVIAVMQDGVIFWRGQVLVPGSDTYDLPIPKGALFGKTTVVVAVAESGAVTSIQYGQTSGANGALSVVSAGVTEITPASDSVKADRIAQAQPENCK